MIEPGPEARSQREFILLGWFRKAFSRGSGLTLSQRLRKGYGLVIDVVNARWSLRLCDSVGFGARVKGRMRVENRGSIVIGEGLSVVSRLVPTEFLTGTGGRIAIGNSVWINFGTVIAAHEHVKVGDRVMIGQHCIISDTDFPDLPADTSPLSVRAIEIGDDAWLAGRVTVRPGVKIGAGAVVIAGSIVESDVPAHVIAGGIPARPLSKLGLVDRLPSPVTTLLSPPADSKRSEPKTFGYLIADFTIDELATELRLPDLHPCVGAKIAPFGQVWQSLLLPPPADAADFAVIWTKPEGAISSFSRVLAFESVDEQLLCAEVEEYCGMIEKAALGYRCVFVPTWTLPSWDRGLGMLDARNGGASFALADMNLRLMKRLASTSNVFVLNAARWFEIVGSTASNPKAWFLGKMAVSRAVLVEAARDIRSALGSLAGGSRKLLVLDLDDTLWGGTVGELGWEGLRLGGLDGSGEAFLSFQMCLKDLKRRGVLLAIVSKNEESVALEAIRLHPSMVLGLEDFAGWRINWDDKAKNILELATSLKLGLQSVVFIDDNPIERARVSEALPEVYVPDWPNEEYLYPSALRSLRCFDAPALSLEDRDRTRMYADESRRSALLQRVGSIDEWLKTLDIRVTVKPISSATSSRAAQLLNKTNQLNLSTRRLTENELMTWAKHQNHALWVVEVSDRIGDAGLTGLLGLHFDGPVTRVVDFVLSCRVMGRRVEETIAHVAVKVAAARSATTVLARYLPTTKNKPCLAFWCGSGFENQSDSEFTWDTSKPFALPAAVSLVFEG